MVICFEILTAAVTEGIVRRAQGCWLPVRCWINHCRVERPSQSRRNFEIRSIIGLARWSLFRCTDSNSNCCSSHTKREKVTAVALILTIHRSDAQRADCFFFPSCKLLSLVFASPSFSPHHIPILS